MVTSDRHATFLLIMRATLGWIRLLRRWTIWQDVRIARSNRCSSGCSVPSRWTTNQSKPPNEYPLSWSRLPTAWLENLLWYPTSRTPQTARRQRWKKK